MVLMFFRGCWGKMVKLFKRSLMWEGVEYKHIHHMYVDFTSFDGEISKDIDRGREVFN